MELLSKSNTGHIMWKQFEVGMEYAQLQIGVRQCLYNYDYAEYESLLSASWIKSQWRFFHMLGLHLKGWHANIPYQRENDS